jgi:PAS domain S-box-containing protein
MPLSVLESMGVKDALERVNVPSYVIDSAGVIRWVNPAGERLVGDVRGRQFTSVVAPEETRRAQQVFARKVIGNESVTDTEVVLIDRGGDRLSVEVSSIPLVRGEHVVGVFGQLSDVAEEPVPHPELQLTPRQAEVLALLERGRSTEQIADELHSSRETVRNHVRHLLRAIGVHTAARGGRGGSRRARRPLTSVPAWSGTATQGGHYQPGSDAANL